MKKSLKITLILLVTIIGIILIDSIQALVFNNSPFLKVRVNYNGGNLYYIDKGILVNTYSCSDKTKETVIKGKKINCQITSTTIDELNNINNKIIEYFLSDTAEYDNLSYNYVDITNKVVVVGLIDNSEKQQEKFKKLVINSDLIVFVQGEKNVDNLNEAEGVSMTIKEGTLTRTGATVIITDVSGKNNIYGTPYRIDKKENGKWKELNDIVEGNYAWTSIGYQIGEDNTLEFTQNWEALYGKLEDGEYRLVKDTSETGEETTHYFSVEFTIK